MNNYIEIENTIKKLLPILEKYNTGSINYQINQLKLALEVITSSLSKSEKDEKLFKIKNDLYPFQGGLTDFNVWNEDVERRMEINKSIDELTDKLWILIK